MIQPSAQPATGSPLLGLETLSATPATLPGERGGSAVLTAQFAELLAKIPGSRAGKAPAEVVEGTLADTPSPAELARPANPVAALRAALGRALGAMSHPASGKQPGKSLPGLAAGALPDREAARAELPRTEVISGTLTESLSETGEETPDANLPSMEIPRPAALAASPAIPAAPASPIPAPPAANAVPPANASPARATREMQPFIPHTQLAAQVLFTAATALPGQPQDAEAPVLPALALPRMALPSMSLQMLAQPSAALTQAVSRAAPPAASSPVIAVAPTPGTAQVAQDEAQVPAALALAHPAFASQTGSAPVPAAGPKPEDAETAAASAIQARQAPAADAARTLPASQPLLALHQSEPLPGANPAPPASASPAIQPPRDFASLIDRLVEAREAAQASLSTQSVQAALSHTEFGKVSLQFQQDGKGLTVAMTSADPDFARAVQAAAPSAQTSSGTESGALPQRQDGPGQQPGGANLAQSQSHSQQRGQPSPRETGDPRPAVNPGPHQGSHDEPPARAGIFA